LPDEASERSPALQGCPEFIKRTIISRADGFEPSFDVGVIVAFPGSQIVRPTPVQLGKLLVLRSPTSWIRFARSSDMLWPRSAARASSRSAVVASTSMVRTLAFTAIT
jgi:hypothetical protein